MFKKIEIWILYLVLVLVFISYIIFGSLVLREHDKGHHIPVISQISKASYFIALIPKNIKKMFISEVRDPNRNKENRFQGKFSFVGKPNLSENYLLLSRFDGDIKESVVELIDLRNFDILHSWNPNLNSLYREVNRTKGSQFENLIRDAKDNRARLFHPFFDEDGSLIFHCSSTPLFKIDKNSQKVWMMDDVKYHHSIEEDQIGNFWLCVRYFPYKLDSNVVGNKYGTFLDDGIRKISPTGEILFEKSISELFIENEMEYLLFSVGDRKFTRDPIHLNDIQPVENDTKYWKKGDVFLSLRHQSMVLLYRPETNEIIWKGTGKFYHQHDVDILDDSRISIFDNNSKDFFNGDIVDGNNRVIIYDFETTEYSYYLNESLINEDVRTITEGRSQILPNGDLFIEETNYGRTLYYNANESLKHEFINRADNGQLYFLCWSRILYTDNDLAKVHKFLHKKEEGLYND